MSERLQIISEELSKSVRSANDFLQLKSPNHDGIKKIHNEWINPNNEELLIPERLIDPEKSISFSHIEESAKTTEITEEVNLLRLIGVGILGLNRIFQVSINSQLKMEVSHKLTQQLDVVRIVRNTLSATATIEQTIHGNSIIWPLEFAQDEARTAELQGNTKNSMKYLVSAIEYGDRLLHENTQLDNPKRTAAIQSGLAVCKVRLGRIQGIQSTIFSGLMNQSQANRAMFNKERTITLAKWAIDSGIRDKRGGFNYQRLGNIILGTEMLLESLFRS